MNIHMLDEQPRLAAAYMPDRWLGAQIVYLMRAFQTEKPPIHHDVYKWCHYSEWNLHYARDLLLECFLEDTRRRLRVRMGYEQILQTIKRVDKISLTNCHQTEWRGRYLTQKQGDEPTTAFYRRMIWKHMRKTATWTNADQPPWWPDRAMREHEQMTPAKDRLGGCCNKDGDFPKKWSGRGKIWTA